uniref:Domain of unknown function DB domain-containing protein n=1 Tax=Ditylenchus dipsaci TaxID=166011 RepID=A0A915CMM9_9BILA
MAKYQNDLFIFFIFCLLCVPEYVNGVLGQAFVVEVVAVTVHRQSPVEVDASKGTSCARRRVRAHGSNTLAVNGDMAGANGVELFGAKAPRFSRKQTKLLSAEKSGPRDPNQMFFECCEERGLPDACLQKCNFNSYTKESLMGMYFRTDACPIEAAAELQYCAARGQDHRACCARNSVQTTLAGEKCLTFCDQRPGNVTQLDFSYASCYDRFEQMKGCFWHSALATY